MNIEDVGEDWGQFYMWLDLNGYDVVRGYSIFRLNKYITHFDPQEDSDSGEIEETLARIKQNDSIYLSNRK